MMADTGSEIVSTWFKTLPLGDVKAANCNQLADAIDKALQARDEWAAKIAKRWADSHSCDNHDYDPCCHVRTGRAIEEAIRKADDE